MKCALWLPLLFLCPIALGAAAVFPDQEEINYVVNWPSGLSLGEGRITAAKTKAEGGGERWQFDFSLEAAVPGFQVLDKLRSIASSPQLCSVEFEKNTVHGKRKTTETTTFDSQKSVAVRQTLGGGKSEIPISGCARDALAFFHFLRRELAQGRLPSAQTIYFGAPYRVRLEYGGVHAVRVGDTRVEADRLVASLKGPSSEITIELFFARDPVRTLVEAKVPLALGTFSMELVR